MPSTHFPLIHLSICLLALIAPPWLLDCFSLYYFNDPLTESGWKNPINSSDTEGDVDGHKSGSQSFPGLPGEHKQFQDLT